MELIAAILAPLVATVIVAVRGWLQATITPERLATVSQLARVATDAAEEIGRATSGDVSPGEKFEYAETFLRTSARRVGVKLTSEEANGFIHSVLENNRNAVEGAVRAALNEVFGSLPEEDGEATEAPAEVS